MKIILSRKGFDSSYGGYPSMIFENGIMQTLPIPNAKDSIKYADILCPAENKNLYEVMKRVNSKIRCKTWIELSQESTCHLDPDIDYRSIKREKGWRGCFGQGAAAQSVLKNNMIGEGDLFIFFGWFNKCYTSSNGLLKFDKGDGMHVLYGYLQVDSVIYTAKDEIPSWLMYHPHVSERHILKENNCIYIAKEFCTWNSKRRGYGVFNYSDQLRLTKVGESRSKWDLPEIFRNVDITYHSKDSWKDDYFQSAHRGQEFVVNENDEIQDWAIKLIEANSEV